MIDGLPDMSSSHAEDDDVAILPKMSDITNSTQGSDGQHQMDEDDDIDDDSVVDLNAGVDPNLPEDDEIFNSSELGSSGILLGIDSSTELSELAGVMPNKEEVRKSLFKGKSALSTSRQKNNILKAVPVEPVVSSLHSSFSKGANRKQPSAANNNQGPPITEAPTPGLSKSRSLSHDDLRAAGTVNAADKSNKIPEEGDRAKSVRRISASNALRAGLQPNSSQGSLPAFCTPRRGPENDKKLQVNSDDILDVLFSKSSSSMGNSAFGAPAASSSGPKRGDLPARSKSGPLHRMTGGLNKELPSRTSSLDGFSVADVVGRRPKSKSTDDLPKLDDSEHDDSSMTLETKKAWDALDPSKGGSLLGGPAEDSFGDFSFEQGKENKKLTAKAEPVVKDPFSQLPKQQQQQQKKAKESSRSRHDPIEPETNTKDKTPKAPMVDTSRKEVSKSARQSTHSAISNESPNSNSKEEELVMMWSCWACEYDYNSAEHVFCGMCGTGRDWHCPSCEHDNKSTFNFCGMCGTRKGRVIIHKEQPEDFNMRMRKGTKKKTMKKISNRSSKAPGSPVKSVASTLTAKSSSRRSSAITPRPPKLDSDGGMSASDRFSTSRRSKNDEASAVSERVSNSLAAGENGEQPPKRSSRGRGREKRESKRGESKTRGASTTRGESKQRSGKNRRSTSRTVKDGRERKSHRNSLVGGEEKKSSRKHKSSKNKGEKVRRPRVSASVPPGERPGERKNNKEVIKAPRPELNRSNSESKVEIGDNVKAAHNALIAEAEASDASKGKSWLKKTVGLSFTGGKSSEENKGILGAELNATDHSMWRPASEVSTEADFRGSVNSVNSSNTTNKSEGDVLTTPSIKKRLFKMGNKAVGIPGKLFKSTEMGPEESSSENRCAEITISRSTSGENLDSLHFQKQFPGQDPATPSLKKRLLGTVGWGKSQNEKMEPGKLLMEPAKPSPAPTSTEETLPEADDIMDSDDDERFSSMDPLEGLSQGLVVTAKDMRPNRPNPVRRKPNPNKPNPNNRNNRRQSTGSGDGFPAERKRDRDRRNSKNLRRTKSGDSTSMNRRPSSHESDNSSVSDKKGRGAKLEEDPLGDMSEAESIDSLEM